jgi:AraC-like DNA-binding protein
MKPSPTHLPGRDGQLWLPSHVLSGCVLAAMSRRWDAMPLMSDADFFNHYPASPYCTLSWWIQGQGEWCELGGEQACSQPRRALPRITFNGPQRRPVATWCRPPFHGLMLLFRPEALRRLTGLDVGPWLDKWVDAREVLPASWHGFLQSMLASQDDLARMRLTEQFIGSLWRAEQAHSVPPQQRVLDWCEDLARRAAMSEKGRSVRQFERRFKQWLGLTHREIFAMGRAERAFFEALAQEDGPEDIDWPDVAALAGYADQSHMIRQTRRITGFTPASLFKRVKADPSFWTYRLWGIGG